MSTAVMAQVITEIVEGSGLGLGKASRLVPVTRGERVHPATLSRWIRNGVRTPDGRFVHLEAARIGDRWLTSREALARFMAALTPPTDVGEPPAAPPADRGEVGRRRACDAAVKRLSDAGA